MTHKYDIIISIKLCLGLYGWTTNAGGSNITEINRQVQCN